MRITACLMAAALLLIPGISSGGAGRSAVQTLVEPVSARPAGLGEAYSAVTGGADSLGYNPAGLAQVAGQELLVQYHGGFMGDTFLNAGYAMQAGYAGFGVSVLSYNSGSVDILKSGAEVAVTGQRDLVYMAGAGTRLPVPGLSAGAAFKYVSAQVAEQYSGNSVAGDAGVRYDIPGTGLTFAGAAQNFGPGIRIAGEPYNLPSIIRAGAAYQMEIEPEGTRMAGMAGAIEPSMRPEPPPHLLVLSGDTIFNLGDRTSFLAIGAEFSYQGFFAFRTGIRAPMHGTGYRNAVAGFGIGAKIRRITLDYAVEAANTAFLHRVSMGFVF